MMDLARSPLLVAESEEELGHLAAAVVIQCARDATDKSPSYDFILSGGNTPKFLFRALVREHRLSISWEKVRFFWSDERNVPPEHPESNYRMAKELLLDPLGIQEHQIFRIRPEIGTAAQAALDYERTLRSLFPEPSFDLALLGLGEDGHTASLFPDAWAEWSDSQDQGRWVSSVWVPHLRAHRITLLPKVLSACTKVLFLVSGASKSGILKEVLDHDPSEPARFPAQLIRPRPLWLADRQAASGIRQAA